MLEGSVNSEVKMHQLRGMLVMTGIAAALAVGTAKATASPLSSAGAASIRADAMLHAIHHKPGHHGGPPWARRGDDDGSYRGAYRDDDPPRRTVCRMTYRTVFDRAYGQYVQRPVQVCG
jgi:hypothetical protein